MTKVHVVGAGPAGSIAAISAIRSGYDVVVSEEHASPGIPQNCSGLLSADGLSSLKDFFDYRKSVICPVFGADIHFLDERFSVRRGRPVGFVCDRSAIDRELASKAEEEGARINYNELVRNDFHAHNIIGADGPLSAVARRFSFSRIKRHVLTFQAKTNLSCEEPGIVEVFLSNKRFPGFFAWVIPHDEYTAELGVGVEAPCRPLDAWRWLLKMKGLDQELKPQGAVIPITTRPGTAMRIGKWNVLLAGDAAGQVKAVSGGGVVFGGQCAALAGRYASNPLRYDLEWRLRLGPDLSMHRVVRKYLSSLTDPGLAALGRRLKRMRFDEYLSNHGCMDKPTNMVSLELLFHSLKVMAGMR
jgi:flavin-dependent dehydrogenase